MANLTISSAATLTGAGTASGDLFPLLDISASAGSQGSKITRDELRIGMGITGGGVVATGGFTLTISATGTAALLETANTFTAGQTITPSSAATALTLTGGTVTTALPVLNMTQTWNNAGVTFTALKLNVTNTASAAASLLMDLQVGGTSQFSVTKAGNIAFAGNQLTGQYGALINGGGNTWGAARFLAADFGDSTYAVYLGAPAVGYALNSTLGLNWTSTAFAYDTLDLTLRRKAAANLQLGVNAASSQVSQIFSACGARIGTDTNTTPTNTFTIAGPHNTGTGTGGDLRLGVYGTNGASGTAIGTLNTVLTIIADRKVVNISSIPTSSAGLSAGDVYSNAGILTIV